MAIYELSENRIEKVPETTFEKEGIKERKDLQRLLRSNIEVVSSKTLIISEEFSQWDDSKKRIDLLGLDKNANLVVFELKRSEDGGHMELQALRYSAMVSAMTFEQVIAARASFQKKNDIEGDAEQTVLDFLEWKEPDEDQFAQDVRIILVSADFSKELTTSVIWLNNNGMDIQCVRLKPYKLDDRILLDVQQIIPLPEAEEYQIKVREKILKERNAKKRKMDFTRYDISIGGKIFPNQWKRNGIFIVSKTLVDKFGESPEHVAEVIRLRRNRVWLKVEGELDADSFAEQASKDALSNGKNFDSRRWFCDNEELLHVKGHTYAFSNQWGGRWSEVMSFLEDEFREHKIWFIPTEVNI